MADIDHSFGGKELEAKAKQEAGSIADKAKKEFNVVADKTKEVVNKVTK